MVRLGIDLGGTKIEIVAIQSDGEPLLRRRIQTPQGDYLATIQALVNLVEQAESEMALGYKATLGLGIPGALSAKTGRVKNANSTWLIGEDLKGDLEQSLARPVRIANDANCFALAEASQGVAKGAESVFGVIIGTGCGGGLVYRGNIIQGSNSIAGEWGHNPMPWLGRNDFKQACYCGKNNCIETFLSGPGLAKRYQQATGCVLTAKEIVAQMRLGEACAVQWMQCYYDWLAKGLASVINVFDPEVIVLGGGLSQIAELYSEVPRRWQNWVFSDEVVTQLRSPKLGDSAGVIGAAWLWSVEECSK
ncbi:ROK family protein [Thiomicrospira microaerophila]|uniref:ROK family protein n=1 Tax=Thiomicrospira microaerophila TaxID=406020 RepID=UPI00200FA546|nr:ROK family protein [Thiomicrospira microaerophila]UQB41454.1 ROK family protein [Thiomicrospira microaerophila]